MNGKLKLAMRKMGYRLMGKGVWAKPVAYHLFTIRMRKGKVEWTNHFKGVNGNMLVWNSHTIENTLEAGGYEESIKYAEQDTRTNTFACTNSDFGFITREEVFAELM